MVCVPLRVKAVVKFVHKVLAEHVGRAITLVQSSYDWMVFRLIPPLIEIERKRRMRNEQRVRCEERRTDKVVPI